MLRLQEIIGLPVYTQAGDFLGKVAEVHFEEAIQEIKQYEVKGSGFIKNFFAKRLLIARQEVLSITAQKMVVKDLILAGENKEKSKDQLGAVV